MERHLTWWRSFTLNSSYIFCILISLLKKFLSTSRDLVLYDIHFAQVTPELTGEWTSEFNWRPKINFNHKALVGPFSRLSYGSRGTSMPQETRKKTSPRPIFIGRERERKSLSAIFLFAFSKDSVEALHELGVGVIEVQRACKCCGIKDTPETEPETETETETVGVIVRWSWGNREVIQGRSRGYQGSKSLQVLCLALTPETESTAQTSPIVKHLKANSTPRKTLEIKAIGKAGNLPAGPLRTAF